MPWTDLAYPGLDRTCPGAAGSGPTWPGRPIFASSGTTRRGLAKLSMTRPFEAKLGLVRSNLARPTWAGFGHKANLSTKMRTSFVVHSQANVIMEDKNRRS